MSSSNLSSIGNSRKLDSWIDGFVTFTDGTSAPKIFRKWAAVSTVAAALERKVWVRFNKRTLYPNLYALLVGGPGVGKTDALRGVMDFTRRLPNVHLAPTSVSRASLADALVDATRIVIRPGELAAVTSFNSLYVCSAEFGTFLTAYEGEFMSTLNHLWDCIHYDERKRHMKKGEKLVVEHPQLNLIAGTTPAWLTTNLPPQAWSEGFSSRLLMIHSEKGPLSDPFEEASVDSSLEADLDSDLLHIHNMFGLIRFDADAAAALKEWYGGGQEPVPRHPKLEHYIPRRATHLVKLCMVMSAARGDDYRIKIQDWNSALALLLEAESTIPAIFRDMKTGGDSSIMDETYGEVERLFIKDQKGVPEYLIIDFVMRRARAHEVKRILEVMYESNMLRVVSAAGPGGRPTYAPVPRLHHNI